MQAKLQIRIDNSCQFPLATPIEATPFPPNFNRMIPIAGYIQQRGTGGGGVQKDKDTSRESPRGGNDGGNPKGASNQTVGLRLS